jgi:hypothetical protein
VEPNQLRLPVYYNYYLVISMKKKYSIVFGCATKALGLLKLMSRLKKGLILWERGWSAYALYDIRQYAESLTVTGVKVIF